ncbi:hypothetical protein HL658_15790 [Azospirillum sp. RWY-5-1]|uniref:Uncharacterized protein n=1 Tax=Azospirillum oleiclasticum TaxID=2735135 RepID=A0ABX2TE60_9PROT|nr:hypothetical protein [Azospirillum oleiclasticum]NYZ14018.1 hypothetical protein [Azospirillum oleiclasticum]NYZ21502.1 hypothetical protein [Azospirillum oleiclasticum]
MTTVTTQPTPGQTIEQTFDKLGSAAQDAAKELGQAAGRATDSAMQQLGPISDKADQVVRDLGVAANTVQQGCAGGFAAGWDAMWQGNLGMAFQLWSGATASCADSLTASLMALIPGWS